jgi:hypothetical protein
VNTAPSFSQLRLLSDQELHQELTSRDHDEAARTAIMVELIRRGSRSTSRPNWVQWLTLAFSLIAAILAGIAAAPVFDGIGESGWFD